MDIKTIIFLFATLTLSACIDESYNTDKIKGHAFIVDNFNDRNPLEGIYIEVEYTNNEGCTYDFISGSTADENGFFEIDTEIKTDYFGIDSWAIANVYSDTNYSDTLGSFSFQFLADTYDYRTIHLDTFSLEHNIWVIPRIRSLGAYQPDELSINFYNCELVDSSLTNMTFYDSIDISQTFTPVEIKMTMNIQHWLSYGTREFARGSLKIDSKEVAFGYFKLEQSKHTLEGDTLYLDFDIEHNK